MFHPLDLPLMSVDMLDISPGFESRIAVTPKLYDSTEAVRRRFSPEERGCRFDGEMTFKYLDNRFFRYSIGNCLFEATYEKILETCR